MKTRSDKKFLIILGTAVILLDLYGCGGSLYKEETASGGLSTPLFPGDNNNGGGGGGSGTVPDGFDPTDPIFNFSISGNSVGSNKGPNPVFSTLGDPNNPTLIASNSILRVKLTMGAAGPLTIPGYEAYFNAYTCGAFTIVARRFDPVTHQPDSTNYPQVSPKLAVDNADDCRHPLTGQKYTSESTHIFDFSVLTNGGNSLPFFFEVRDGRYNWHCSMYATQPWNPQLFWFQQFCTGDAMRPLHYSHMATGSIQIDTNGPSTGN